jgi:hypothetical protein
MDIDTDTDTHTDVVMDPDAETDTDDDTDTEQTRTCTRTSKLNKDLDIWNGHQTKIRSGESIMIVLVKRVLQINRP